jgi:membrane peptidoglycan carboxypeptidase
MLHLTNINAFRQRRRRKEWQDPAPKIAVISAGIASIFLVVLIFALALAYSFITSDLPSVDELVQLFEPPDGLLLQPTKVYDRTGQHLLATLENPLAHQHEYLFLDSLFYNGENQNQDKKIFSNLLVLSTIALTDPAFLEHDGYTIQGILNPNKLTITQKLISELLLWNEQDGLIKNIRASLLAAQATKKFGKQKILTWYLNQVKYGQYIYGADAAARAFFNKSASDLNLLESATLVAASETPSLNPISSPQLSKENTIRVLTRLLKNGVISQQQFEEVDFSQLSREIITPNNEYIAPLFIQYVLVQLSEHLDINRIEHGGYRVVSTLNYDYYQQTECALIAQIQRVYANSQAYPATDLSNCDAAQLLPTLPASVFNLPARLSASAVILDPQTGELLSLASVVNQKSDQFTIHPIQQVYEALQPRQPGTILSPFIYLTGFTQGFSPSSLVWDIPDVQNIDETKSLSDYHGPVRIRNALANDYLDPVRQVFEQVGSNHVLEILNQMGLSIEKIKSSNAANETNTLKDLLNKTGMSILSLSQAYGVLANQGILVGLPSVSIANSEEFPDLKPLSILFVEDIMRNPVLFNPTSPGALETTHRPVVTSQLAYLLTNILADESARWESLGHPNPLEIGRPAAAKIGRLSDGNNSWIIGYTPQLVTGVWIGDPDQEAGYTIPPTSATGIWHSLMQYTGRTLNSTDWTIPSGITKVNICDPSGMLPTEDCPSIVSDYFLDENIPTQVDTLYRRLQVNRETGKLATIFTPPELIENRIYLIVPTEAEEWALQSGLYLPPKTYDPISTNNTSGSETANITSPTLLAYVKNQVIIHGTAAVTNFASFQIRVGRGLKPEEWLEIPVTGNQPVHNGKLAIWDTSGLNGLYTIQLMVISADQQVESKNIQVTVDNQPPEVAIDYPSNNISISTFPDTSITFQISAEDEMGVSKVVLYLDGELLTTLTTTPFVYSWIPQSGEHVLAIKAFDQAGNSAETTANFLVDLE